MSVNIYWSKNHLDLSQSPTWTKDSTVNSCSCWFPGSVDLPPVNVTIQQDAKVLLRFTHPWLVYSTKLTSASNLKRRKKKSSDPEPDAEDLLPEFEYSVIMDKVRGTVSSYTPCKDCCDTLSHVTNIVHCSKTYYLYQFDILLLSCVQRHHNFICEESVCEETLPVDDKQGNHCLTITGVLEKMIVKTTQLYCAAPFTEPPKPNSWVKFFWLLLLTFLNFIIIWY